MKILDVPTSNISELKKSPKTVFKKAQDRQTGLYVFSRDTPAGVVLSVTDYERLVRENNRLQEENFELKAAQRLKHPHQLIPDEQVRGDRAHRQPQIDENDGWE